MNRKYNLKLDLQFRCNNSIMKFNQFDNNTSDFFMRITNGGNLVDIEKALVVLAVIKPSGKVASQFVEVKNGIVYADLKPSMKDEIGTYTAKAMLILEDERVVTDAISYEVEEDKIFSLLNDTVEATEEFTLLADMLSRLSTIEISEEQRMINEAERILSEENRKIEEAKRVEAELIRQHEEADRAKYDATRESNENIRKINEEARISSENVRLENEANRIEQEANRVKAEQLRKDNYNLMTEDEERRRLEANAHKEAEVLRVQAETNRVNEEAKRRTTEQARILAENTRVSNENTRKANETTRQTNETHRVEAETQRQNRYNSFIADAEANASNFENYTNNAKVKEEERKSNELDRKSQETKRVSNEVERISNENTRKANEVTRIESEKQRADAENLRKEKIIEIQSDYDSLKKVIIDENASANLQNQINQTNSQLEHKSNELDAKIDEVANTGTTMEAVHHKVEEMAEQGLIQAYTLGDGSIPSKKLSKGILDGTDIMASKLNNVSENINEGKQGEVYRTNSYLTATYPVIDGVQSYVFETLEGFTGRPTLSFHTQSTTYIVDNDTYILLLDIDSSVDTEIVIKTFDENGTQLSATGKTITAGTKTYSQEIYSNGQAKIEINGLRMKYYDQVGKVTVNNFRLYKLSEYNDFTEENLKTIIDKMRLDIEELKKQEPNIPKLFNNKGEKIVEFSTSDFNIESGDVYIRGNGLKSPQTLAVNKNTKIVINENITLSQGDNVCFYVYINKDEISQVATSKITLTNGIDVLETTFNKWVGLSNGWTCIKIDASELTKETFFTSIILDIKFYKQEVSTIFFDSVYKNIRLKPCIMLNFDNCRRDNLYEKVYPLLSEYGFKGTFALSKKMLDNDNSIISKTQLQELIENGWDYAIYGGIGTRPSSITDYSLYSDWRAYIKALVDSIIADGFSIPTAYFCPNNASSSQLIAVQKELGIKMNRCSNGAKITDFYTDSFETNTIQIRDIENSSLETVKSEIDKCIREGNVLSIFTHQIVTDVDLNGLNVSEATYRSMLDYIKSKVDEGLVKVITYKEFIDGMI